MVPDKFTDYVEAVYSCKNRVQLVKNQIDDRIEYEESIEGQDQLYALVGILRDVESDLELLAEEPFTEQFGNQFKTVRRNSANKGDLSVQKAPWIPPCRRSKIGNAGETGSNKPFIPRWRTEPICKRNNIKDQKSTDERLDKAEPDLSKLKLKASESSVLNEELQHVIR